MSRSVGGDGQWVCLQLSRGQRRALAHAPKLYLEDVHELHEGVGPGDAHGSVGAGDDLAPRNDDGAGIRCRLPH